MQPENVSVHMFKTLRYKILFWLLTFFLIAALFFISFNYFFQKKENNIFHITSELNGLQVKLLKIFNVSDKFFFTETKNPAFLTSCNSFCIDEHMKIKTNILQNLQIIKETGEFKTFKINDELDSIDKEFTEYCYLFDKLVDELYLDGNKNAGVKETVTPVITGLKYKLDRQSRLIESDFNSMRDKASNKENILLSNLKIYYFTFLILAFFLTLYLSKITSKHIVLHLEKLNIYISNLVKHKFNYRERMDMKNPAVEIKHLYRAFRNMTAKLYVWEKQKNHALSNAHENEKKYRELADLLPQSIFETDELGNLSYVNKEWYRNFKYTEEDINEGLNLIEIVISQSDDDILGDIKLENSNFIAMRKDGTRFPASVYTDNIIINEKVAGKRGIIINITNSNTYINALKNETHKAKTSDKLKSSFLANMSHEIRTPMNSIIGFANLLTSSDIEDTQKKEFVAYIKSSGEQLMNLIDDIIDIAKIEAGEIKINKQPCNLYELTNELHKTFAGIKNKLHKGHVEVILDNSCIENLTIKTDPFRLKQVLSNLINNALKFTDDGCIEFGYSVKDSKSIEFFVRDTGIGLSREEIGIIFERFKRTKNSEEQNIVGTGLGLAISKNLVELLGGDMWVDSHPGKGTTFFFTVPYLKTNTLIATEEEFTDIDRYNWTDKTILIVEDDEKSFTFLKEAVKLAHATVLRAEDGLQAIEMCLTNQDIDLVLMDIHLPKLNGLEATKKIKQKRSSLPIIAQTGFAMAGDKEKCLDAGCDDHIAKPVSIEILLPKVNQFLQHKFTSSQNKQVSNLKPGQFSAKNLLN